MNLYDRPVLLLVDIQKGMDDLAYWGGERNNPEAELNASRLLDHWRKYSLPVIHIKHNSTNPESRLRPGQPGNEIKEIVRPVHGETIIEKKVNSAFIGTDLQKLLEEGEYRVLVIAGLTTDHCVSSTTRMASNLGYLSYLISDACATFGKTGPDGKYYKAQFIHDAALASLNHEFTDVLNTQEIIQKVLNHSYPKN